MLSMGETQGALKEQSPSLEVDDIQKTIKPTQEGDEHTPVHDIEDSQEKKTNEAIKPEKSVEPLLIIRSSLPNFLPSPGQPSVPWEKWLRTFENYTEQMGKNNITDSNKYALLQNYLGQEGRRILAAMFPGETTYAGAVSALSFYFSPNYSSQIHMLSFNHRAQTSGESASQFISALNEQLKPSNCQELYNQLLFKQVAETANKPELFSSVKAPQANAEMKPTNVSEVTVSVDEAEKPVKRKRGRPRKSEVEATPPPTKTSTVETPKAEKTQRACTSRKKDFFYYDGDEQFLENEEEDSWDSKEPVSKVKCKEIKDEPSDKKEFLPPSKSKCIKTGPSCPICIDRRFQSISKLVQHMRSHSQQKPYNCPICSVTFSQSYHLLRHMRNQHNAGEHVCSRCGITLDSATELLDHKKHHPAESVPCPLCDKVFPTSFTFAIHIQAHCRSPPSQEELDRLPKTKTRSRIDSRTKKRKNSAGVSSLSQRGTPFNNIISPDEGSLDLVDYFKQEVEEAGPGRIDQPVSDDSIDDSDEDLMGKWELVGQNTGMGEGEHLEVETQGIVAPTILKRKQESLKFANKSTGQTPNTANIKEEKNNLETNKESKLEREHSPESDDKNTSKNVSDIQKTNSNEESSCNPKKSYLPPKRHRCPHCKNRWFTGTCSLARHMRMHTQEKPYKCPVCDISFSQSYHMKRHCQEQHSQGRYTCVVCEQNFSKWIQFKNHQKMLHGQEVVSCPFCEKPFKDKSLYLAHIEVHKNGEKLGTDVQKSFACSVCGSVFKRKHHLQRHILHHHKKTDEYHTCSTCEETFVFAEDLERHIMKHEKEKNGICPICSDTFDSLEELMTHKEEVHNRTCSVCGKKFKLEHALKKHEESHANGQYYCIICSKFFPKEDLYQIHMQGHEKKEHKCPHCQTVFSKPNAFKAHLRTHVLERPYQCVCCLDSFEQQEDFDYHCLKHKKLRKERPYSCTRCDWAFATLAELAEHMTTHEGEQPANCPVCGRRFLNKNKLEKHMSLHTGVRPHLCSICGDGFMFAATLKLHVNIHTGYKPFKCDQCPKSFRTRSCLKLHSRQHMEVEDRPKFECPDCGRTYGRKSELKMHQRYHTGDKPHACTCCNKRFISRDKLNVHMRIHTGERPYSCPHCGQTFSQYGDRNRHVRKFH